MLGLADVDATLFPETAPSGTVIGEVSTKVADELGLPQGVVCVTGGHDQPCGALGAGIIQSGEVMRRNWQPSNVSHPLSRTPVINQQMIDGNFRLLSACRQRLICHTRFRIKRRRCAAVGIETPLPKQKLHKLKQKDAMSMISY